MTINYKNRYHMTVQLSPLHFIVMIVIVIIALVVASETPPPDSAGGAVRVVCPRAGLCPGLARSRENPAEPPRGATAAAASERNAEGERCKTDSESLK